MSQLPVRVLLVEDDEDDAVLTRTMLRDIDPDGFELEWVADYDQAIGCLTGGGYDVCLVDYRLGLHDGVEFIRQAVDRGAGAPIILLTGQGDRDVDVRAMNAGAADFLNKDRLNPALLERAIRYSIQQKKAEQQRIRLLMEQAARAEAEAANRAKDEFLAVLSHELRTPLTAVLLNANQLELEAGLSAEALELVRVIKRNIDLEVRLIDDLLDLTRITRGKLELRREVVDINEQIQHTVCSCCGAEIEQKGITVQLNLAAGPHHVWGDPARIQQVLWNLLKNAVKFTPRGGRIDVATSSAGQRIAVKVKDTGIGIKAEALPRIFNAFEQTDPSITRRFGGLGLGLAICKVLIEMHGGTIRAESDGPGHGATFSIELPLTHVRRGGQSRPGGSQEGAQLSGISILLVEDHPDTAQAMQRLLRVRGFAVQTAGSIAEAMRLADAFHFDVLISDIGLPDGSGLELMRRLEGRSIKGIALSGFGMEEDVEKSRQAGFAEHLTKPIDLGQLEAAIERVTRSADTPTKADLAQPPPPVFERSSK